MFRIRFTRPRSPHAPWRGVAAALARLTRRGAAAARRRGRRGGLAAAAPLEQLDPEVQVGLDVVHVGGIHRTEKDPSRVPSDTCGWQACAGGQPPSGGYPHSQRVRRPRALRPSSSRGGGRVSTARRCRTGGRSRRRRRRASISASSAASRSGGCRCGAITAATSYGGQPVRERREDLGGVVGRLAPRRACGRGWRSRRRRPRPAGSRRPRASGRRRR